MEALEMVALAAWCFAVALAGGLVGLVLGNIRLPVVLIAASSPAAGAGANIGISGVAAAAASVANIRAGRVHWRLFLVMAPPSVIGALIGGYISGVLPDELLLVVIGAALLYFGVDLLKQRQDTRRQRHNHGELNYIAAIVTGGLIGLLGASSVSSWARLRMPALLRYVGARNEGPRLESGRRLLEESPPRRDSSLLGDSSTRPKNAGGQRIGQQDLSIAERSRLEIGLRRSHRREKANIAYDLYI